MRNQILQRKSQMKLAEDALRKIDSMSKEEFFEALRKSRFIEDTTPLFRTMEEALSSAPEEHSLVAIGYPLQHLVYRVGKNGVLNFSYHVNKDIPSTCYRVLEEQRAWTNG